MSDSERSTGAGPAPAQVGDGRDWKAAEDAIAQIKANLEASRKPKGDTCSDRKA